MHKNEALLVEFYDAFRALDGERMGACYHPDATFSDPVFPDLRGAEVPAMWRMLCGGARDWNLSVEGVAANDQEGSARWRASYSFGRARRPVRNVVASRFRFRDGLIAWQADEFDLHAWSRMALGLPGALLGWSPWMQARIRSDARRRLHTSMRRP